MLFFEAFYHIITDSEFVKLEFIQHFSVPEGRITTIHLGPPRLFSPATNCHTSVNQPGLNDV